MKAGDYRDDEVPWRLSTERELKARMIVCEVKDCERTGVVRVKTNLVVKKPWLCSECMKIWRMR